MTVRNSHIILFLLTLLCGCGRIVDVESAGDDVTVLLGTKSEMVAKQTFRVMNHSGESADNNFLLCEGSETYFLKNVSDGALTPCNVDDDGKNPVEKPEVHLGPLSKTRRIVMVSPAMKHNEDGKGSFSFDPETVSFYSTDYVEKVLGNYGVVSIDKKLYERKTKLNIKVYEKANSDVSEFEISDVKISGGGASGKNVTFYPATNIVIPSDIAAGKNVELNDVRSQNRTGEDGDRLIYESDEATPVILCSGMYVPREVAAEKLGCPDKIGNIPAGGDYLYLECKMTTGNTEADLKIGITSDKQPALNPQSIYNVNFIVISNYIDVNLDVYDVTGNNWQIGSGSAEGNVVEKPSYTVKLGTWSVKGWESVNAGENEI